MWDEIFRKVRKNYKPDEDVIKKLEELFFLSENNNEEGVDMLDLATLQKKGKNFFEKLVRTYKLEGILIVDLEGLPLLTISNKEVSEEMFAASAASIIASIQMIITDLDKGAFKNITIETERGFVTFSQVGNYILVILSPEDVKLGIVRAIMKQAEEFLQK
ncbi:MAG: hypothetical protein DSY42_09675 [Aquifex sp.]|nr:MAG: hypothetical protein DSY42_09675 [Aquifex sp.]